MANASHSSSIWPQQHLATATGTWLKLNQPPFERLALASLIAIYLIGETVFGPTVYAALNVFGPLTLAVILLYGVLAIVRSDTSGIWLGSVWLRIIIAFFFAIGSAAPFLVDVETRAYIDSFYRASPEEFFKVNLLTASGVLVLVVTMSVLAHIFPPPTNRTAAATIIRIGDACSNENDRGLLRLGLFFGLLGVVVKDVIVLPYTLGLTTVIVPAVFLQVSHFTAIGIFLVARWALRRGTRYVLLVLTFTLFDSAIGVLSWNKTDALFPILMFAFAFISAKPTLVRMAVSGVVVLSALLAIKPVVDFGRGVTLQKYGHIVGAGIGERIEIMMWFFETDGDNMTAAQPGHQANLQSTASRFAYISQSAFAVSLYDEGSTGNSFSYVPVVLIPRIFWPGKPNLNEIGLAFNIAATGGDTSLSWPGPFAESYWNFGWWGIPIYMIPTAMLLFFLSRYTYIVFQYNQWARFPVVLFGIKVGLDIGGPFATVIAGSLTYLIVMHLACIFIEKYMNFSTSQATARRNAIL